MKRTLNKIYSFLAGIGFQIAVNILLPILAKWSRKHEREALQEAIKDGKECNHKYTLLGRRGARVGQKKYVETRFVCVNCGRQKNIVNHY